MRLVGIGLLICTGCATVDPRADFARARELAQSRTSVTRAYDPHDNAAGEFVRERIAGGLTQQEAVEIALFNNRDFQASFEDIGVSRAELVQSALLANPTLALGFNFPEGGGLVDITLGFAQQIADLWQIPVRKEIAAAQLERTILAAGRLAVQLTGNVRAKYVEVQGLQRALELTDENAALARRTIDIAERQKNAGAVSEFDVNLTRNGLIDIQATARQTRGALGIAKAQLTELMGLSRSGLSWDIADPLANAATSPAALDELVTLALAHRLDARVAEMDVRAAEGELARQARRVWPNVRIGFSFQRTDQRALPGRKILADTARSSLAAGRLTAPSIESRGARNNAKQQIIDARLGPSLLVTLPVWDQNHAQIAIAAFRARQARIRYEQILDRITLEVRVARIAAEAAAEVVQLHQSESLPLAEKTLSGAEELYRGGESDVLVLVNSQSALVTRRQALVAALQNYGVAMANLHAATGGDVLKSDSAVKSSRTDELKGGSEQGASGEEYEMQAIQ